MPRIFDNIELGLFSTLRETLEVASRSVWLGWSEVGGRLLRRPRT